MSTQTDVANPNGQLPPATAARTAPVVIRRTSFSDGSYGRRAFKRQLPAWIISGGLHVVIFGAFLAFTAGTSVGTPPVRQETQVLETKVEDQPEQNQNFENTDVGLDPDLPTNYNIDRIEDVSVPGPLKPDEPVGIQGADAAPPQTVPPPPGFGGADGQGGGLDSPLAGAGNLIGTAGGMGGKALSGYAFRGASGATRQKMVTEGGGNTASEAAVARALAWLAKMQKPDGRWTLDGSHKSDVAGTGIALLPFLAAGITHKAAPPGPAGEKEKSGQKYVANVAKGVTFLIGRQKPGGDFGTQNMYEHAIVTMALCEAYGMTADAKLKPHAQKAVDFIVKAQHQGGGWRYTPGQAGDTSVTGWQVQALKSGQLAGLSVPKEVWTKVRTFLDGVAGNGGATYGYVDKGGTPAMTAVGLLCRQYNGWGPNNPSLAKGVDTVLKKKPPLKNQFDVYYYYYATQVMHFFGGPDWKAWNEPMRDLLIELQEKGKGPNEGSWAADAAITGQAGGRLLTTCLSLLTLEVYYRHLPLYRRDAGGLKELEGL